VSLAAAIGWTGAGVPVRAETQKQWKDRPEFDLYDSITKETNTAKRMDLLNTWTSKYPDTQFRIERLTLFLNAYKDLNQAQKMVDTAKEMQSLEPKNFTALYWLTFLTPSLYAKDATADQLETGEKASRSFLEQLDTVFAAEKKPANLSADQWKKTKTDLAAIGHHTLGWIAKQRKNYDEAEREYRETLVLSPEYAAASLELGQTIFAGKKAERQPEVLFHYARATSIQGPTALDPAVKSSYDKYVDEAYVKYHGGKDGLDDLRSHAKASPVFLPDYTVKSVVEIEKDKIAAEEAAERANPMLALWKNIRTALVAPDGPAYFEDKMKGAGLPAGVNGVEKFKGKLVSMTPAVRPKELVLSIEDSGESKGDVTLKFETGLPGKMEPGAELSFDGVAEEFVKDPFMVTFSVEKGHLSGWDGKNEPAARKGTSGGAKKASAGKKQ
jgi:tetratricopeptide (TPR) repeat protein